MSDIANPPDVVEFGKVRVNPRDSRIYRRAAIAMRMYAVQNPWSDFWDPLSHAIEIYAERAEQDEIGREEVEARGEVYTPSYYNPYIFQFAQAFLEHIGKWDPAEYPARAS